VAFGGVRIVLQPVTVIPWKLRNVLKILPALQEILSGRPDFSVFENESRAFGGVLFRTFVAPADDWLVRWSVRRTHL
jgi:hypothetical protein